MVTSGAGEDGASTILVTRGWTRMDTGGEGWVVTARPERGGQRERRQFRSVLFSGCSGATAGCEAVTAGGHPPFAAAELRAAAFDSGQRPERSRGLARGFGVDRYRAVMQSLNRVLAALRQEIDAGLTAGALSPSPWSAGKVVVELELVGREEAGRISFAVAEVAGVAALAGAGPDAEAGRSQFTLHLRLELLRAGALEATLAKAADVSRDRATEATRPAPAPAAATTTEPVFQALCGLFGAPGFDSSARACVFREALEGLSDADVAAVIARLAGPREGEVAAELERARELLSRVVRSGPAQSFRRGAEILTALFALAPVAAVLRLVEERWETQRDWMNR